LTLFGDEERRFYNTDTRTSSFPSSIHVVVIVVVAVVVIVIVVIVVVVIVVDDGRAGVPETKKCKEKSLEYAHILI
jgi:hypothetical protein